MNGSEYFDKNNAFECFFKEQLVVNLSFHHGIGAPLKILQSGTRRRFEINIDLSGSIVIHSSGLVILVALRILGEPSFQYSFLLCNNFVYAPEAGECGRSQDG